MRCLPGLYRTVRAGFCGTSANTQPTFGLLFDIDGVLVRGKTPIPAAERVFQKLVDSQGRFIVPVVFVTNAGNCLRQAKAEQLSHLLGIKVCQEQVMMSHSPLRMFRKYHDKCVLVSGQGPVMDIAKNLGFANVVSIDMIRERFPMLDVVDHHRRPKLPSSPMETLPQIDAVILFGEPIRWETNLQLIIDVLLTNGMLGNAHQSSQCSQLPLLACNMDLMWMAEARSPRFGHGAFLVCLENIYKKITGKEIKYEVLMGKPSEMTYHYAQHLICEQAAARAWSRPITSLYAIGDNVMTDIYGANLYHRYLCERSVKRVCVAGAGVASAHIYSDAVRDGVVAPPAAELAPPTATCCHSVLVCTGVYDPHTHLPVTHGHRDFGFDPALVQPTHTVEDVEQAVQLVFQQEGFDLEGLAV